MCFSESSALSVPAVVCNMALLSENNTSPEFYLRLIATLFPRDALGIFWTRCFRRLKSIDRRVSPTLSLFSPLSQATLTKHRRGTHLEDKACPRTKIVSLLELWSSTLTSQLTAGPQRQQD
ncbi:uncharacterized protein LOC111272488 [Varroa jacobsoni]|uniref:uncharacterized protein LOC111272488 n=1 Tax=Varroa jacobsoni TaxID=62625 RepID=UPI000BF7EA91|nr:uncharacterized protein LOC111272488 [Varroa jacobsoni]